MRVVDGSRLARTQLARTRLARTRLARIRLVRTRQRRLVGGVIRGLWVRAPDGLRGFGGRAPQPPEAKPGNFGP